jgi:hypothetical protein
MAARKRFLKDSHAWWAPGRAVRQHVLAALTNHCQTALSHALTAAIEIDIFPFCANPDDQNEQCLRGDSRDSMSTLVTAESSLDRLRGYRPERAINRHVRCPHVRP